MFEDRQPTTTDDDGGQGPTVADTGGQRPTLAVRSDPHTLTTTEVLKLFEAAGLPRSQRSIERYCKDGKLDSFLDPDEGRHYVSQTSVHRLIGQLKELEARHMPATGSVSQPSMSESVRQVSPASAEPLSEKRTVSVDARERVKNLEDENLNLRIDNRAKEMVIIQLKDQIKEDRATFTQMIGSYSRKVGELSQRLLQLTGGRTDRDSGAKESNGVRTPDGSPFAEARGSADDERQNPPSTI